MSLTSGLFWRSVLAFVAMPLIVAFVVPWFLLPHATPLKPIALPILIVGTVLLLWCVRDFYVAGQGTLAPWEPPKRLVIVGLYRISRNPMYLAVLTILTGWAVGFASAAHWIYVAILAVVFHVRVVGFEEPWLARTFGADWSAYRGSVLRWVGRARG